VTCILHLVTIQQTVEFIARQPAESHTLSLGQFEQALNTLILTPLQKQDFTHPVRVLLQGTLTGMNAIYPRRRFIY
jgi:hypothetical protein